jgi:glycine C-acetyltransferase/8-amino-7-oxononanoate synthase
MTEPEPLQQIGRTYVRAGGRRLSYFSGCDYFRLASHPQVVAALSEGVEKYGLNVAASRLTTGNHKLYVELERRLAQFFDAPSALVVSSGYVTNLIVAQTLAGTFSHALVDEEAHPSLSDASRFLDCPVLRFRHRDPKNAERAVQRCGPGAKLILLTDGMFSRDGSAAPLAEYLQVLPKDALMLVDDAHGAGVLGPTGKGTLEHAGVDRARIIQTITLSKAFGVYGGAILGSKPLRKKILDRSQLFVGSTPPPLPLASAALESLRILETDATLRQRLLRNAARVKAALRKAGLDLADTPGPIIFIRPRRAADVARLSRRLLAADIYPPFLKYPNGPAGGYFRFVISSEHTRVQLHGLIGVLIRHARE